MIYILSGDDYKKKSIFIKNLSKNKELIFVSPLYTTKELINNYADNQSLFGDSPIVVFDNILKNNEIIFSKDEILNLKNSRTIFVFIEDKLLAKDKTYDKYAEIVLFEEKKKKQISPANIFSLSEFYAKKNKIKTWVLYQESIQTGIAPEAIAGMIFWKIKDMALKGSKVFNISELKHQSSEITDIYHKSHTGEYDLTTKLEQFILSSLDK